MEKTTNTSGNEYKNPMHLNASAGRSASSLEMPSGSDIAHRFQGVKEKGNEIYQV